MSGSGVHPRASPLTQLGTYRRVLEGETGHTGGDKKLEVRYISVNERWSICEDCAGSSACRPREPEAEK